MGTPRSHQLLIALLGLVGVLATGILSNWDKLTSKNPIVQAQYTGYQPTGDFETELRYFFEVSGTHTMMDTFIKKFLESQKLQLLSQYPQQAASINDDFDAMAQEMFKFDDVVKVLLPVYQKHYTVGEIQALNRFYSTDVMRQMVREGPLIAEDVIPLQNKLLSDYLQRLQERIQLKAAQQSQLHH